jgi:uncharacterized protein
LLFFVALLLAFVVLIHVYLWKRLVRDPLPRGRARTVGQGVAVVLGLLVPVTLIGVRSGHVRWLAWPGYLWLAVMFYLLVTLAVLEVPRLVIRVAWRIQGRGKAEAVATIPVKVGAVGAADAPVPASPAGGEQAAEEPGVERRLLLARGLAIFAGLTAVGVTGYGMRTALGPPQLNRVQMPMPKLPRALDGTRLVVVSDIHLGPFTGSHHVGRIVDLINSVNADIVCVVGDLVDGTVAELGRFAAPLAGIQSRQGAYFVTGNHEYYSGFEPWIEEVTKLGVRPLRNERVELGGLDLAGVNDLGGDQFGDAADFGKALGDRDKSRPVVLMAHQPLAARQAAPYGVDLQVSGHTHGGQMAPFNLLVPLQQPVVSGFGDVDGVPVYVTNGAGFWGPPVRVGAPPQVTVVELRST